MNNNTNTNKCVDDMKKKNILTSSLFKLLRNNLDYDEYYFFLKIVKDMKGREIEEMFNRIIISKCVQKNIDGLKKLLY